MMESNETLPRCVTIKACSLWGKWYGKAGGVANL